MSEPNPNSLASNDSQLGPQPYEPGQTTLWNRSWRDLYERLGDVILMYARQEGLNDHSAQDVLQEVMVTVLRSQRGEVAGHNPAKGSFRMWLKGVVHNRIRSTRRKDHKENPLPPPVAAGGEEGTPSLPDIPQAPPDFEEMDDLQWQKAIITAALQRVRDRVHPDNFAIYMSLLEEKASPAELAATYQKQVNNIYRIKNSCQAMLSKEAREIKEVWGQLRHLPS